MPSPRSLEGLSELRTKPLARKSLGVAPACVRAEAPLPQRRFERADRLRESLRRLIAIQETRRLSGIEPSDRFRGASAAQGDHRYATRLRFDGRDSKILIGSEHEGARAM